MRIRDLLAPESIQLNGSATGKESLQERKRVPQELERALQFLIANQQP